MTPEHVMIHHSLTKDSGTVSWGAIRKYHTETKHWNDIGYHFGVELANVGRDGEPVPEILMGRGWSRNGAHCRHAGMNRKSLGVCIVGNYDEIKPPDDVFLASAKFVAFLCNYFGIDVEGIVGHRDFNPAKSCPGELFDLDDFRECVEERL